MTKTRSSLIAASILGAVAVAFWWTKGGESFVTPAVPKTGQAAGGADLRLLGSNGNDTGAKPVQTAVSIAPAANATLRSRFSDVLGVTDPIKRSELLLQLLKGLSPDELVSLLDALPKEGAPRDVAEEIVRHLASLSPGIAARWLGTVTDAALRVAAAGQIGTAWAAKDFPAALAWATALPKGGERNIAVQSVAYEAAKTDPKRALELLIDLPADADRDDLLVHAARQWAAKEPATAAAWGELVGDTDLRARLLADIASTWAATNPKDAASYAVAQIPPGRDQERAAIEILQKWTTANPAEASAWAISFQGGELKEVALRTTIGSWAEHDPVNASEWIQKIPSGAGRDQAVGFYAVALAETDPAAAIRWIDMLPAGDEKVTRTVAVTKRWLDLNGIAARAWIEKSGLSEVQKKDLLQPPR